MNADLKYIYDVQKEVSYLVGIYALLDWDEKTHMPKNGIDGRAEQSALLYGLIFEKLTSPKLVETLKKLRKQKMSEKDTIVVKELDKQITKLVRVPKKLAIEIAKEAVTSSSKWQEARTKNDFEIFKPHLKKMIELRIKQAKFLNPKVSPYDALLDDYEEGMTSEKLTNLFEPLKKDLIEFVRKVKQTKQFKTQKEIDFGVTQAEMEALVKDMIEKMGINKEFVALDVSAHPFTTRISENDVRITTRYPNLFNAFFSSVHESGHALYELGMPKEYKNTVIYDAPSLGIHESQSRFWENMIAKSKPFWKGYVKTFAVKTGKKINWEKLYHAANLITPSFIRTEADEATYCLHVILRFEIERDLINGTLKVEDAKELWNKKMQEFLGVTPKNYNDGILQDVHWSSGLFGYFPTYAIGTIYSSQLYAKIRKEIKNFDSLVEKQEFEPILKWLRKNVHNKGRTKLSDDIIKEATGNGLDPNVFIKYLNEKYKEIYEF